MMSQLRIINHTLNKSIPPFEILPTRNGDHPVRCIDRQLLTILTIVCRSFFPPGNVDTRDLENQFLKMSINKEIASHQNTQATLAFCRHICSTQRQEMANQERIAAANKKVILSLRDEVWEAEVRRSASQRVAQVNVTAQLRRYQEDYLAKTQKVRDVYLEIQQWVNAHKVQPRTAYRVDLDNQLIKVGGRIIL